VFLSRSVFRPVVLFVENSAPTSPTISKYNLPHLQPTATRYRLGLFLLAICSCIAFATPADAQLTIMKPTSVPVTVDSNDGNAVEVGVKFRADSNGTVTGLRFYKAKTNAGTHVGHIWSKAGVLLGSATFTGETASGWQQVNFANPIAVTANTTYIASYFAPLGHYSDTSNAFASAGIDAAPLHALANGVDGGNGVYRYSTTGFPTSTFQSTNYWVDIVFTPQTTTGSPQLTIGGTALNFGSVAVNSTETKSATLTSSGTSPVTISSTSMTGSGFSLVAGSFPITLNPKQSLTLQLEFSPVTAGAVTGQFTINSNAVTNSKIVVSMSGTGTSASPQLTESATSLSFGSVPVNSAVTESVTLTSTGSSAVTVNSAAISGAGFSIIGGSFPVTLNTNQSVAVQVQFKPVAVGTDTGKLTISSNSTTGSTSVVALGGTATSGSHQVDLSWNAPASSPDPVAGYNIYRTVGSAAFQLLNSSPDTSASYLDKTVVSGTTYEYTVKCVDKNGVESPTSNEITVAIP
jgi:Domain of unknown function (DUF4082)/Abnormal spindle-like microcephaly-assoc'd, ASPM-SPD-2-Hydin